MKDKITGIIKKIFSQREVTVFLIILLVVAITSIIQPKFLNSNNMRSIALSVSVDGLFAIGLTMALILGGIELSVGSVAAMTCVITGYLALQGVNIWVACIASIASGLVVGLFNGFMISKIGLPPFIVTLGMENLARGMASAFCFRIFFWNTRSLHHIYNNFGDCIYLYEVFKDMQEYILRRKQ